MEIEDKLRKQILKIQRSEINGHHIYKHIARMLPEGQNREIINKLSREELGHYRVWKRYTQHEISPNALTIALYSLAARILGFTFAIKLLERDEESAQISYAEIAHHIPEADEIRKVEEEHEEQLLAMLDEERLRYVGSIVLGMNDALVELTGALAGLTLAFQNTSLIALSGLITGISASISMAASEYLSTRAEKSSEKHAGRSALYTGLTYIITVALLIAPYLIWDNYIFCLAITLIVAVVIIALFNFYVSVARGEKFFKRFLEMSGISLGVAALSFLFGFLIRQWLGVEI